MGKNSLRKLRTEEISPLTGKRIREIKEMFAPRNITFQRKWYFLSSQYWYFFKASPATQGADTSSE